MMTIRDQYLMATQRYSRNLCSRNWGRTIVVAVVTGLLCCEGAVTSPVLADDSAAIEHFEKQVRPVLIAHCVKCHGVEKQMGGLRLDVREGWVKGGDSGAAIVPGDVEASLLVHAIRYTDTDIQMPPEDEGGKLSAQQVADLEAWVKAGAHDPRTAEARIGGMNAAEAKTWWAFQPLKAVAPPLAIDGAPFHAAIDAFIDAGLEKHALLPAPPADKRTLLRRATFDLTGLPPTPEETDAFLKDLQPEAFMRVVERLLASPHYGERWGRHWLDVVRYTDLFVHPREYNASYTYELHEAYRYRDWVVAALNRDLPYDQFITHQLAGDLLPAADEQARLDGLAATGFLCIGSVDHGDADKDKIVSDIVDDQIDVAGKAFLGLTVSCARCHDHKFDPITAEDYYGLAGIFYSTRVLEDLAAKGANTVIRRAPFAEPAMLAERAQMEKRLAEVTAELSSSEQRRRLAELSVGGVVLMPSRFASAAGAMGRIDADGAVTVSGAAVNDTYTVEAVAPSELAIKAVRLEALADASLPVSGPGRAGDGNFVLNQFAATFAPANSSGASTPLQWVKVSADFEQVGFPVAAALEGKPNIGWAVSPQRGVNHAAVFEVGEVLRLAAGTRLAFTLTHNHADTYSLGKFRVSVLAEAPSVLAEDTPENRQLLAERDALQKVIAVPLPLGHFVQEGGTPGSLFPAVQDVNLHLRGSYTRLGPVVKRRMPEFFAGKAQPEITGSGRLQMAQWIASPNNPLTARVMVNRVWQHHFGEGLSRTPNNFGKLGDQPSHPELLDWLAVQFIQDGWSVKQLHRCIMQSAAYQRSSAVPPEMAAHDPDNRWLARMNARRLEAEPLRDAMLAVSGQLDRTPGGPATADLMIRRRTLYVATTRFDRSNFSTLFDAANPEASVETRTGSTVAPQALFLLNNPFVLAEARHLAARLNSAANDDPARVRLAFELVLARLPTEEELQLALSYIAATSWDDYTHTLLCSNEFAYLD